MANIRIIDSENLKDPEAIIKPENPASPRVETEIKETPQQLEPVLENQDIASSELKQKIEGADASGFQSQQAQAAQPLPKEKERIDNLLRLAEKKGVEFAINEAKKMNNPYILDKLHDELAKDEKYKDFLK